MRKTVRGILSKFDKMIADLETAISKNDDMIGKNNEEIYLIEQENKSLSRENSQGRAAVQKLKELIGQ